MHCAADFERRKSSCGFSNSTLNSYLWKWEAVTAPRRDSVPLDQVSILDIQEWLPTLKRGNASAALPALRHIGIMKHTFGFAKNACAITVLFVLRTWRCSRGAAVPSCPSWGGLEGDGGRGDQESATWLENPMARPVNGRRLINQRFSKARI